MEKGGSCTHLQIVHFKHTHTHTHTHTHAHTHTHTHWNASFVPFVCDVKTRWSSHLCCSLMSLSVAGNPKRRSKPKILPETAITLQWYCDQDVTFHTLEKLTMAQSSYTKHIHIFTVLEFKFIDLSIKMKCNASNSHFLYFLYQFIIINFLKGCEGLIWTHLEVV